MNSELCVSRQLRRLSYLEGFPEHPEGIEDLENALRTAPDDGALEAWVNGWVRQSAFAPKPADIYRAFDASLRSYERPPSEPRCKECGDTGWRIIERGGYSGAERCGCRISPPSEISDVGAG